MQELFLFPQLPVEISGVIHSLVVGQLTEEKHAPAMELFVLGGLLAFTAWSKWKDQETAKSLEAALKKCEHSKSTDAETIDKVVAQHNAFYYNNASKKVHKSVLCAYRTEKSRQHPILVDQTKASKGKQCKNCFDQ